MALKIVLGGIINIEDTTHVKHNDVCMIIYHLLDNILYIDVESTFNKWCLSVKCIYS